MNALPIPQTAPFAEEEIEILNRVVGPASPTQRAWLAGFLAGVDAAANSPQPAPAAQPTQASAQAKEEAAATAETAESKKPS